MQVDGKMQPGPVCPPGLSTKESCSSHSPPCPTGDVSALPQAGGFPAPWLLCHLFVSLPATLPAAEESPEQLQSQWRNRRQPLPNSNPPDAKGHLTLFVRTYSFLPSQPIRRSQPPALLLRPSHLPSRLPAAPALHHGTSCPALTPSPPAPRVDYGREAKRMGTSMKLGATKQPSSQAVLLQNFPK